MTGGPGSGKSTLIDRLEQQGFARSVEAGRAIIQDQTAIGGSALPWKDKSLFAELMLSWEYALLLYGSAGQRGCVLRSRSTGCRWVLRLVGLSVPEHMRKAVEMFPLQPQRFSSPHRGKQIFQQDRERKQDFDEAVRTYNSLVETYTISRLRTGGTAANLDRKEMRFRPECNPTSMNRSRLAVLSEPSCP